MNYKYLGEAIALLGIAYSVVRWIIRNAPEADRSGAGRIEIDLARLHWPSVGGEGNGHRGDRGQTQTPTPDPEMLNGEAAMFGVTPAALIAMDPRERALLLSGYRAARDAAGRAARVRPEDE